MIPVSLQPEPTNFDTNVRKKGEAFLKIVPRPQSNQWKNKEFWRDSIEDLRQSYSSICAYCAQWVPHPVGLSSVDHYEPKSKKPNLAYEWSNFRLACPQMNSNKKDYLDVLDPFSLADGWFELDFDTFMVVPNPDLQDVDKKRVLETIARLKLNSDEAWVTSRISWVSSFKKGEITFQFLEKRAPFIAHELARQELSS